MPKRSWLPRVRTQAEFWIFCRGHQDASLPKRITAFRWVDRWEHGHQSGVAVLVARAACDDGILGAWEGFWGVGKTWGGISLI
jgi:hypothetical protein